LHLLVRALITGQQHAITCLMMLAFSHQLHWLILNANDSLSSMLFLSAVQM
jgi:hypothetical protein